MTSFDKKLACAASWATASLLAACLHVPALLPGEPEIKSAPTSAEEILSRHIAAIGGEEALRRIGTRTVEARMRFLPEVGCTEADEDCQVVQTRGSFAIVNTSQGRLYSRFIIGDQVEEHGFDGTRGWRLKNGVLQLEDEQAAAKTREDSILHWYLDLADRNISISLEAPLTRDPQGNARTLDGIRWHTPVDDVDKTLWFERDTGLLYEEVVESNGFSQRIVYDDHRPVDGILLPHMVRVITKLAEREKVIEFFSRSVDHEEVQPNLFAVPTLPSLPKTYDGFLQTLKWARGQAKSESTEHNHLAHARAAWEAARFEEVDRAADAVLVFNRKEPEALWLKAKVAMLSGRLAQAAKLLNRAEAAGLRPGWIAIQRAWLHVQREEYRKAATQLDRAASDSGPLPGQQGQADPRPASYRLLAGMLRSFVGKPYRLDVKGPCSTTIEFTNLPQEPLFNLGVGDRLVLATIDTGAEDLILEEKSATAAGVKVRSKAAVGPMASEAGYGQAPRVKIGDFEIRNVPAQVFPTGAFSEASGGRSKTEAVVGVRFLQHFQVTVDLPRRQLTLVRRDPRCRSEQERQRQGVAVPFWVHNSHYMYVRAELNGAEGLFLINTGMSGAGMMANDQAFRRAGISVPTLQEGEVPIVRVESVSLHDERTIMDVEAVYGLFLQEKSLDGFRVDGMLGLDVLAKHRWTIDFEQRKFYVGSADAS